jgi:hypothetical protein
MLMKQVSIYAKNAVLPSLSDLLLRELGAEFGRYEYKSHLVNPSAYSDLVLPTFHNYLSFDELIDRFMSYLRTSRKWASYPY